MTGTGVRKMVIKIPGLLPIKARSDVSNPYWLTTMLSILFSHMSSCPLDHEKPLMKENMGLQASPHKIVPHTGLGQRGKKRDLYLSA